MRWFWFLCAIIKLSQGAKLPSELELCHYSDAKFTECLSRSIAASLKLFRQGYKSLGIPVLQPLFLKELQVGRSEQGSSGLEQTYTDVSFFGAVDTVIQNLTFDYPKEKSILRLQLFTPKTIMRADYKLNGQVLIFPINGHGKCNVTLYNITSHHEVHFDKVKKGNKVYVHTSDWFIKLTPEKVIFDFENIIPGNPSLSDQISHTINENALDVFKEVIPAFEKSYSIIHMTFASLIFDKIPVDEIFLA